ncbi:hypothetical protein HPULCUR_010046 [Helicostylum pulchrum]|uniref:Uncharacterized protein n=1 Tax=Helicostylum pulchrum TaxID=562976 RepID=A0ABP9YC74_9FUNG
MKSQSILLLLATLAVLARDVTCEIDENENEKDENEKDENEKDENEGGGGGGGHKKILSDMAQNGMAMSSSTTWEAASGVPSASVPLTSGSAAATGAASAFSSAAADAASLTSAVAGAASSWGASVANGVPTISAASGSIPAVTRLASSVASAAALPSVSAARPYAGPSVISGSSHLEVSIAITTIGICAFLFTLV